MPSAADRFSRQIERLVRKAQALDDEARRRLIRRLTDARKELHRLITSAELAGLSPAEIQAMLASVDASLIDAATDITNDVRSTYQERWALGEEMTRVQIEFGMEYFEGATGFKLAEPVGFASLRAVHEAFTFERITQVTQEMRTWIKDVVYSAYLGGRSPFDAMRDISNIVGLRSYGAFRELGTTGISAKAERILRTELMAAQNLAGLNMMKWASEMGVENLMRAWMATGDTRTRDSHLEAHGQIVKMDEPFMVGGCPAMFPGDPGLPAKERVNCRCVVVAHKEEWGDTSELWGGLDDEVQAIIEERGLA